jgi:hypothetical protein
MFSFELFKERYDEDMCYEGISLESWYAPQCQAVCSLVSTQVDWFEGGETSEWMAATGFAVLTRTGLSRGASLEIRRDAIKCLGDVSAGQDVMYIVNRGGVYYPLDVSGHSVNFAVMNVMGIGPRFERHLMECAVSGKYSHGDKFAYHSKCDILAGMIAATRVIEYNIPWAWFFAYYKVEEQYVWSRKVISELQSYGTFCLADLSMELASSFLNIHTLCSHIIDVEAEGSRN